jgi:hypothetical protein
MSPEGFPLWVSEIEPGSTRGITAARVHVLGTPCTGPTPNSACPRWPTTATTHRNRRVHSGQTTADDQVLDTDNRTYNTLLRGLRCLGERGFAALTGHWCALRHITTSLRKIGTIVKAALVLTHFAHGRLA